MIKKMQKYKTQDKKRYTIFPVCAAAPKNSSSTGILKEKRLWVDA
jgi:hypothetical protein